MRVIVDDRGRVTIPYHIRKKLNVLNCTEVEIIENLDNTITLEFVESEVIQ